MALGEQDPRKDLLSSLDLPSCRVEFSSAPIVLVCGGRVPPLKTSPKDPDPEVASLRHALTIATTRFEIFRPEEIQDWQSDATFKNLVSFERELAGICSLIVLILESPGSLAELGAFSQLTELASKTIVICSDRFDNDTSFINLGILRFLRTNNPSSVKSYPWDVRSPDTITNEVVTDVVSDIDDELAKLPKSEQLRTESYSHATVLISELLRLFVALKESEIKHYLSECGISLNLEQLREKLFLLRRFKIIIAKQYSDSLFYLSGPESFHGIRLAAKSKDRTFDSLRVEALCLAYYSNDPKQKNRNRAITTVRTGGKT